MISKKMIVVLALLAFFAVLIGSIFLLEKYFEKRPMEYNETAVIFYPSEASFKTEIADTIAKQVKGLMFRENLPADQAMIFVFDKEAVHSFWMKNVQFPLDLIFISANKKIVEIKENFPACSDGNNCETYKPKFSAKYVLEIKAGEANRLGLQVGDSAEFNL